MKTKGTLAELDKINIEIIQDFRKTKKSKGIPGYLQLYIIQLDKAAEIWDSETSIRKAAVELQINFPELSFETCRNRISDAINYFHLNNTVKEEAWDNYFADKMMAFSKKCEDAKDYQQARLAMLNAHSFRKAAAAININPNDFKPHNYYLSPDTTPERLGLKESDLKVLWPESKKFINELPIDSKHKKQIINEAAESLGEETEFEDVGE